MCTKGIPSQVSMNTPPSIHSIDISIDIWSTLDHQAVGRVSTDWYAWIENESTVNQQSTEMSMECQLFIFCSFFSWYYTCSTSIRFEINTEVPNSTTYTCSWRNTNQDCQQGDLNLHAKLFQFSQYANPGCHVIYLLQYLIFFHLFESKIF